MESNNKKNKKIIAGTTAAILLVGAAAGGTAAGIILTKKQKFEASKKEATETVNAIPDDFYRKQEFQEKLSKAKTYEDYVKISAEAKIALDEAKAGKEDPEKVKEAKLKASLAISRLEVNNKLRAELLNNLNKGEIKIADINKIEKEAEKEYQADRSRKVSENKQTENYVSLLVESVQDKEKSDALKDKLDALKDDSSIYKNRQDDLNQLADLVKDQNKNQALKQQIADAIVTPAEEAMLKKAELEKFAKANLESSNEELNNLINSLNKATESANENPVAALRKLAEVQKSIEAEIKKQADGDAKLLAAKKAMLKERINSSNLSEETKKSEIAKIEATANDKEFERALSKAEVVLADQKENDVKNIEKAIEEALKSSSVSSDEILNAKKEQLKAKINESTLLPSEKEVLLADLESATTLAKFNANKEIIEDKLNQEKEKETSKQVAELLNSIENEVNDELAKENQGTSKTPFEIKKEIINNLVANSSLPAEEKQKLQAELNNISSDSANALQLLKVISNKANAEIAFSDAKNEANKLIETLEDPKKSELKAKLDAISSSDHNEVQKVIAEALNEANSEDKKDALVKAQKLISKVDDANPRKDEISKLLNNHQDLSLAETNKLIDELEKILDSKEEGQVSKNKNETKLLESLINSVNDPNKKAELQDALNAIDQSLNDNSAQVLDYLNNLSEKVSDSAKVAELKQQALNAVVTPEKRLNNQQAEISKLAQSLSEAKSAQLNEKLTSILNNSDLDPISKQIELDKLQKEVEQAISSEKGPNYLVEKQKEILNARIDASNLSDDEKTAEKQKLASATTPESLKEKEAELTKVLETQIAKDIKAAEKAIDDAIKNQNTNNSEAALLADKKDVIKNLIQANPNLSEAQKQDLLSDVEDATSLDELANEKAKVDEIIKHENKKSSAEEVAKKLSEITKQAESIVGNQIGSSGLANKKIEDLKNSINNSNLPDAKKTELINALNGIDSSQDNAFDRIDQEKAKINKELELQAVKDEALAVANRLNESEEKQRLIEAINNGTTENIDAAKQAAEQAKQTAQQRLTTASNEAKSSINKLVGLEDQMTKLNSDLVNASTEEQRNAIKATADKLVADKLAEAKAEVAKLDENNPKRQEILNKINQAEQSATSNYSTYNDLLKEAQAEESKEEEKKKAIKELESAANIPADEKAKLVEALNNATDMDQVISKKDEIIQKKEYTDTKKAASDSISEVENVAKKAEFEAALSNASTKEEADRVRANAIDYKNKEQANKAKTSELRARIEALKTEAKRTELLDALNSAQNNSQGQPNGDTEAVKRALEGLLANIDTAFENEKAAEQNLALKKQQLTNKIAEIGNEAKRAEFEAELNRINGITDPTEATRAANALENSIQTQKAFETKKSNAQDEINRLRTKDSAKKAELQRRLNEATTIEQAQAILEEAQQAKAEEDKQIEAKRTAVNQALEKLQDGSELKTTLISKKEQAAPSDDNEHREVDLAELDSIVASVTKKIADLKAEAKAAIALTNGLEANGEGTESHDSLNSAADSDENQTEEKLIQLKNKAEAEVAKARNAAINELGQVEGQELSDKKKALQAAINDPNKNISELKELLSKVTLENSLEAKAEELKAKANKIQDPAQRQAFIDRVNNLMNSSDESQRSLANLENIESDITSSNQQQETARNEAYAEAKAAIDQIEDEAEKAKLLKLLQKDGTDQPKDDLTASDIRDIKNAAQAFENYENRKKEAKAELAKLPEGNALKATKSQELEDINNSDEDAVAKIQQIKRDAETELQALNVAVEAALVKIEQLVDHESYASLKQKVESKDTDNNEVSKIEASGNKAEETANAWKAAKTSLTEAVAELPNGNAEKVRINGLIANKENINNLEKVNNLKTEAQAEKTKLLNAIKDVKDYIDQQLPTNAKTDNTVASTIVAKFPASTATLTQEVNEASKITALKSQIDTERTNINNALTSAKEVYDSLPEGNSVKVKHQTSMTNNYFGELVNTVDKITAIKTELEGQKTAIDRLKQEIKVQLNNENLKDTNPRKSAIKELIEGRDVENEVHPKEITEFEALKDELIRINNDLDAAKRDAQAEVNKLPASNTVRVSLQELIDNMDAQHDEASEINSKIRDVAKEKVKEFADKYELINTALEALPTNNPERVRVNELVSSELNRNSDEKLRETEKLDKIETDLTQLKTDLDSAKADVLKYTEDRLPQSNTVRTNIETKLNAAGEDADEVAEINGFKANADTEVQNMTTAIESLKTKLEELPSNDQYRTQKEAVANVALKDQTVLSNESDVTTLIQAIDDTEIPRVDNAKMTSEFDEAPGNAKFNNRSFVLKTSNLNDSVTDNKYWASVSTNVFNVLPALGDNQLYKKELSDGNEVEVNKTTTVGTEGNTIYNLYEGETKVKSFIIFGTPEVTINDNIITKLQGPSSLGTKAEWSIKSQNIQNLVDNNFSSTSRYEVWGDANRVQNNNNFVIYKKGHNNTEEKAWYTRADLYMKFAGGLDQYNDNVPREIRISFSDDGKTWKNVENQSHVFDYDWFKESSMNRQNGTVALSWNPGAIKDNTNNGFQQFAQLYGDGGRQNNAGNINQIVRVRTNFTPVNAKYLRVTWLSALDKTQVSGNKTGLKVVSWTEIKPYIIATESNLQQFKNSATQLAHQLPESLNITYKNLTNKDLTWNGEDYINIDSTTPTISASDITINNKSDELSYTIEKIKSFKYSDDDENETYAQFLITVRNGLNETKTFKVGIGNRPVNTNLINNVEALMNDSTNDPKGVLRRLNKDIDRWSEHINSSDEEKWAQVKEVISTLKQTISAQNYTISESDLETWEFIKNLIINIGRENSSTTNTQEFETKLNQVRTKWRELQTLNPDNLDQLYLHVHQPMMNDLSKTLQDLDDHIKWIDKEIEKANNHSPSMQP